jgi:hypothetical protein
LGTWPGTGWGWLRVGYLSSLGMFQRIAVGNAWNLGDVLGHVWHWQLHSPIPSLGGLEIRYLLWILYAISLVVCATGMARHQGRGDPAFLVAAVAPWLLMFTFMPQMHERYLVWAAATSSCFIVEGWGMVIVHFLISAICIFQSLATIVGFGADQPRVSLALVSFVKGCQPGVGWLTLSLAGIVLYVSIAASRQRRDYSEFSC